MGCFPCFVSQKGARSATGAQAQHLIPVAASYRSRASTGRRFLFAYNKPFCCNSRRSLSPKFFHSPELTIATGDFSEENLLGEGGFGLVHKGWLPNGQPVAVKQLNKEGAQGPREFLVEVLMLSIVHHKNLVNLIGYCAERDERLLVYEYMSEGSLEHHLHNLAAGKEPLDWNTRMKIAMGTAEGLEYLHLKVKPAIIYRDLKAANILLDKNLEPKLSDFGFAKLGPTGDHSHVSTRVMGTYGYCAPEYAMTGRLTAKSDVYSYGVVLLELLTGRRAIDESRPHEEQNLVKWARPFIVNPTRFLEVADPLLRDQYPVKYFCQALSLANMCLQEQAANRPSIADVVTGLVGIVAVNYRFETDGLAGEQMKTLLPRMLKKKQLLNFASRDDSSCDSGRKTETFLGFEKDEILMEKLLPDSRGLDNDDSS